MKETESYTPQQFIRGEERSILRNPLLAHILYLRDDIERWGSGIKRIYDACEEAKVKVDFKILKSGFLVIFYRQNWGEKGGEHLSLNQQKILREMKKNNLKKMRRWNKNQKLLRRKKRLQKKPKKKY